MLASTSILLCESSFNRKPSDTRVAEPISIRVLYDGEQRTDLVACFPSALLNLHGLDRDRVACVACKFIIVRLGCDLWQRSTVIVL